MYRKMVSRVDLSFMAIIVIDKIHQPIFGTITFTAFPRQNKREGERKEGRKENLIFKFYICRYLGGIFGFWLKKKKFLNT